MREYRADLNDMLIKLLIKLKKRNPKIFTSRVKYMLIFDIKNLSNTITLKDASDYKECLKIAFDKKNIPNRGDYLIVGLYKLFFYAFEGESKHKITAMEYDAQKLKYAYELLQAIFWKIKTAKDENGNYLFLTWQNNWQVELAKRLKEGKKLSAKLINNLTYIKNKKENLLSPSNLSFEVIFGKMLFIFEKALKTVGVEPKSLSTEALKNILFFL